MSSKWKITGKSVTSESGTLEALTLGFYPREYDYTVENQQTGEERHVTATSDSQVGEKLSKGQLSD